MTSMLTRENDKDRVLRRAIVGLLMLQVRRNMSSEELQHFAAKCAKAAWAAAPRGASGDAQHLRKLAKVLRNWHHDSRYLSNDGLPRAIKLNGRNGLVQLIRTEFSSKEVALAVKNLRTFGLIKKDRRHHWLPVAREAVVSLMSEEILEHLSDGICRLVETVTRNVTAKRKEDILFERSCKVFSLPKAKAQAYREFVGQQALAFLTSVDDWLEGQVEIAKSSRGKKCAAGAFAFAFIGD